VIEVKRFKGIGRNKGREYSDIALFLQAGPIPKDAEIPGKGADGQEQSSCDGMTLVTDGHEVTVRLPSSS
jgi:hypothetical protein